MGQGSLLYYNQMEMAISPHSKCIDHQYEDIYEEFNGDFKFDLDTKVNVISNIVGRLSPVSAYLYLSLFIGTPIFNEHGYVIYWQFLIIA